MKKTIFLLGLLSLCIILTGAGCLTLGQKKGSGTTGPAGMFVSTDQGDSWKQISKLPQAEGVTDLSGVSVFRIFEDPQDPHAMYWATRGDGMFYSYDDGKSWQRAKDPLDKGFIYSIVVHPKDKCTLYATNGTFIYKSTDCNRTWTEVYRETRSGVTITSLDINAFPPHQVFMTETNGDLFQSIDLGKSWNILRRFRAKLDKVISDKFTDGVIYIATREKGLVRSDDSGKNWINLTEPFEEYPKSKKYRRFFMHSYKPDILFWISEYGILVSKDKGESWEPMKLLTAPGSVDIYSFAINPQDDNHIYYAATSDNRSTFYRTVDGGENWITKKLPTGQLPTALRVHPNNPSWIYIGFTIPPQD